MDEDLNFGSKGEIGNYSWSNVEITHTKSYLYAAIFKISIYIVHRLVDGYL